MGIKAEKSPCYLPGSSKALTTTTQIMATKHKQQTPANTTTQKTNIQEDIVVYICIQGNTHSNYIINF